MEASLLKPSSVLFSVPTRGGRQSLSRSRRCFVAAASSRKARSDNGQVFVAMSMTGGAFLLQPLLFPCSAVALEEALMVRAVAVLGDLDPSTAKTVAGVAGPALSALGFLFILRIVMSWYPRLPVTRFPYVLAYAPTEPFLAVTRKVIPPLGGVDVTPVVWFGLVSFLNEILVGPQGLLVLLSQQQQL